MLISTLHYHVTLYRRKSYMKKFLILTLMISFCSVFAETITITGTIGTNGTGQDPDAGVILDECNISGSSCVPVQNGKEFTIYAKNYTKLDKANCAAGTVCTVTGTVKKDGNYGFQLVKITAAKKVADQY